MKRVLLFQVDAFTDRVFRGNPAAVCPLDVWPDDATLQAIAAENNLSETAFFVPEGKGYRLRWFTPQVEVPLCGHATLATAFVILKELDPSRDAVSFFTLSGTLHVRRDGARFRMDFPVYKVAPCDQVPLELAKGLGRAPAEVHHVGPEPQFMCVYASEVEVRELAPDFELLRKLPSAVSVTAPGTDVDFVSRYFAPGYGIPEDPVTGSIHCALTPYWAKRLNKSKLSARQVSGRGGDLALELAGDRVNISGAAVKYLEGEIVI